MLKPNSFVKIALDCGEQCAQQKGKRGIPTDTETDADKENRHKHHKDLILRHEEGLCALMDKGGDLLHAVCACILTRHFFGKSGSKEQCRDTQNGG